MKKLFLLVFCLFLFFSSWGVEAEEAEMMPQEEITEVPALEPMTEKQLNDLFGEEMYIGETDWRGNKVSTKNDYSKKKENKKESPTSYE